MKLTLINNNASNTQQPQKWHGHDTWDIIWPNPKNPTEFTSPATNARIDPSLSFLEKLSYMFIC